MELVRIRILARYRQVMKSNKKISSICSIWFIFFRRIECFCKLQWNIISIFAVEVLIVLEAQAKKKKNPMHQAQLSSLTLHHKAQNHLDKASVTLRMEDREVNVHR